MTGWEGHGTKPSYPNRSTDQQITYRDKVTIQILNIYSWYVCRDLVSAPPQEKNRVKVKVKVTKAHRVSRGIALLFLDLCA